MKTINLLFAFSAFFLLYSCDSNPNRQDSAEVAEERNEERLANNDDLEDDSEFVVEAASGSMMEVELGKIAAEKASSPQVKNFAQKMVNDHTKASERLKSIAQKKNITLPRNLPNEHQKHVENLREKSGAEFDKEYMDLMVDHDDDVEKFEKATDDLNDNELKAWASETLPTLRQHREEAKKIHEGLTSRN
jgi:putative membrane protein